MLKLKPRPESSITASPCSLLILEHLTGLDAVTSHAKQMEETFQETQLLSMTPGRKWAQDHSLILVNHPNTTVCRHLTWALLLDLCPDRNSFIWSTDRRKSHFDRRKEALSPSKTAQAGICSSSLATWGASLLRGHQRARAPSQSPNHDGVFCQLSKAIS